MENKMNLGNFIQICLVVEDMDEAVKYWSKLFNIEEPEIMVQAAEKNPDLTYRGEVAEYGMRMAIIKANGFVIELVEPDQNPSTFREFLNKHGL